jgi:transcriptional regulator of heat shock response
MTPRQKQLLAAIIKEFISSANAVGSVSLSDKYGFNVSPATIRNEMAELVREGYLDKPHSSSGRVPTELGLRFFIEEVLNEDGGTEQLDVVTQEQLKTRLNTNKFQKETLVREALKFLVKRSSNAAIALIDQDIFYFGLSEMLDIPEFQEIENLKSLLVVLEDYAALSGIFNRSANDDEVKVLIGTETGLESFARYAIVFSELRLHGDKRGYIAVVGPNRMNYRIIIPAVGFVARTINKMAAGW